MSPSGEGALVRWASGRPAVRTVGVPLPARQARPGAVWAGMCLHFLPWECCFRGAAGPILPPPMWAVTCEAAGISGRAWSPSEAAGLVPRKPRLLDTALDALRPRHFSGRTGRRCADDLRACPEPGAGRCSLTPGCLLGGGVSAGAEAGRTHRAIPGQGSLANMHGAGALERAKLPE